MWGNGAAQGLGRGGGNGHGEKESWRRRAAGGSTGRDGAIAAAARPVESEWNRRHRRGSVAARREVGFVTHTGTRSGPRECFRVEDVAALCAAFQAVCPSCRTDRTMPPTDVKRQALFNFGLCWASRGTRPFSRTRASRKDLMFERLRKVQTVEISNTGSNDKHAGLQRECAYRVLP